jgi:hypothetical protein
MLQQETLEMSELTLRLMQGPVKPIVVGVESIDMNSGELLRKGMANSGLPKLPLVDSSYTDDLLSEVLLLNHLLEHGMASVDGQRTWPELGFWWWFTEDERGRERERSERLGFSGGAVDLIGLGGRQH